MVTLYYQLINIMTYIILGLGVSIFAYGIISDYAKDKWDILERKANLLSYIVTVVALILTAVSIYLPVNIRPPLEISLYLTAPVFISFIAASIIMTIRHKGKVSPLIIQGLAVIGLAASAFRMY